MIKTDAHYKFDGSCNYIKYDSTTKQVIGYVDGMHDTKHLVKLVDYKHIPTLIDALTHIYNNNPHDKKDEKNNSTANPVEYHFTY